jgi:hypothetical protein
MDIEPHKATIEFPWRRPALYVTIVAIYLFVLGVAVALAFAIYINSGYKINSDYVAIFTIGDIITMGGFS